VRSDLSSAGIPLPGNPREAEDLRLEFRNACRRHIFRRIGKFGPEADANPRAATGNAWGQGGSFSGTRIEVPGSHRDGGWFLKGVTGR